MCYKISDTTDVLEETKMTKDDRSDNESDSSEESEDSHSSEAEGTDSDDSRESDVEEKSNTNKRKSVFSSEASKAGKIKPEQRSQPSSKKKVVREPSDPKPAPAVDTSKQSSKPIEPPPAAGVPFPWFAMHVRLRRRRKNTLIASHSAPESLLPLWPIHVRISAASTTTAACWIRSSKAAGSNVRSRDCAC